MIPGILDLGEFGLLWMHVGKYSTYSEVYASGKKDFALILKGIYLLFIQSWHHSDTFKDSY